MMLHAQSFSVAGEKRRVVFLDAAEEAVEAERERIIALIRREASETFDMRLDHELRTLADRIATSRTSPRFRATNEGEDR